MGPIELMHFQTFSETAGNTPPLTDPTNGLTFPDLNAPPFGGEEFITGMGLFIGQSDAFFTFLTNLAEAADAAQREV